jgi:hypothetical protein
MFTDYRLDQLIQIDEEAFYTFLGGFLVNSIDMFDGTLTDLSYHEEIVKDEGENDVLIYVFDNDMSSKEIYILCLGVSIGWYRKQLDDVTQFKLHLSSKNYKSFSESQSIQRRLERLGAMEENFSEAITQYQLKNLEKLPFFGGN